MQVRTTISVLEVDTGWQPLVHDRPIRSQVAECPMLIVTFEFAGLDESRVAAVTHNAERLPAILVEAAEASFERRARALARAFPLPAAFRPESRG